MFWIATVAFLLVWVANACVARGYGGLVAKLPYFVLFFSPFIIAFSMDTNLYWTIAIAAAVYGFVILHAVLRLRYWPALNTTVLEVDFDSGAEAYRPTRLERTDAEIYWESQILLAALLAVCVALMLVFYPDKEKKPKYWYPWAPPPAPQKPRDLRFFGKVGERLENRDLALTIGDWKFQRSSEPGPTERTEYWQVTVTATIEPTRALDFPADVAERFRLFGPGKYATGTGASRIDGLPGRRLAAGEVVPVRMEFSAILPVGTVEPHFRAVTYMKTEPDSDHPYDGLTVYLDGSARP